MNAQLFEFWTRQTDMAQIERARNQLTIEIEEGILKGVEFRAELYLLNHLLT